VVNQTRTKLGAVAAQIVSEKDSPAEQLAALAEALLKHIEENPGLPRLLFSLPEKGDVATALRHLISMQTSLVTELFRQGQYQGVFKAEIDPPQAGRLFIALVQGLVLQWQTTGRQTELATQIDAMLSLWLHGFGAEEGAQRKTRPVPMQTEGIVALDVRPILQGGDDPLESILAAIQSVGPGGVVKVTAPFRPAPLLALLEKRGHRLTDVQRDDKKWEVEVLVDGGDIEDLRDLEPPEPLERVLEASVALQPGEIFIARLPRFPRLLIKHLDSRGLSWAIHEELDGSALLRLKKK